ncbi:MAG: hypothetical protein ACKVPX_04570 [Myxococcaceae bacterium]
MTSTEDQEDRARLETIQSELSARQSTVHFARCGVAFLVAIILSGAAGKLAWDARGVLVMSLSFVVAGLACLASAYAVVQYRKGKSRLEEELVRFKTLEGLRRRLKLDDPSALLPG